MRGRAREQRAFSGKAGETYDEPGRASIAPLADLSSPPAAGAELVEPDRDRDQGADGDLEREGVYAQ
jgi:hypothetical protein